MISFSRFSARAKKTGQPRGSHRITTGDRDTRRLRPCRCEILKDNNAIVLITRVDRLDPVHAVGLRVHGSWIERTGSPAYCNGPRGHVCERFVLLASG